MLSRPTATPVGQNGMVLRTHLNERIVERLFRVKRTSSSWYKPEHAVGRPRSQSRDALVRAKKASVHKSAVRLLHNDVVELEAVHEEIAAAVKGQPRRQAGSARIARAKVAEVGSISGG